MGKLQDLFDPINGRLKEIQDSLDNIGDRLETVRDRLDNLENVVGTCVLTVTWNNPSDEDEIEGEVTLQVSVSDDNGTHTIEKVRAYFDDKELAGDMVWNDPYWEKTLNTLNKSNGIHKLTARAWCSEGNSKEANINVTIKNYIPPGGGGGTYGCTVAVYILKPASLTKVSAGVSFTIEARHVDSAGHSIKNVSGSFTVGSGTISDFAYKGSHVWAATGKVTSFYKGIARFKVTMTCSAGISGSATRTLKDPTYNIPPPL